MPTVGLIFVGAIIALIHALVSFGFFVGMITEGRKHVEYKNVFVEPAAFAVLLYLGTRWIMRSRDWHNPWFGGSQIVGCLLAGWLFWRVSTKDEDKILALFGSYIFGFLRFCSLLTDVNNP